MIIRALFLCLSGLMIFQSGSVAEQGKTRNLRNVPPRVERSDIRPDLAIKFQDVAQLKIGSRKSMFHMGEMITIDIALLNTSPQPLFFRKLSDLDINATSSAGQKMTVQRYGVPERAMVPAAFVRLSPGEIVVNSFQLLVGCDRRAFTQTSGEDDRTVFDRGLFLNWGDACLPNPESETYMLSIKLRNNFVVLPSRTEKLRSAVGTINSNSLEIILK